FVQNEKPFVGPGASLREIIMEISKKRLGATAVVDDDGKMLGVITDGDLRRMLEKRNTLDGILAGDIMTVQPKSIGPDALAIDALDLMRKYDITQLLVVEEGRYLGIIHLHDLVREGLI
ncbi:MAG TPA: CBS domain-containing protein, partial [Chitinophagaceae bacterium]|nr:CBS domain-containing protein [Chitinophagaceae bacterium]